MTGIHQPSRARRLALLMGTLLHLLGAVAVPFHVWSPAGAAEVVASVSERHDDGSPLPPHDELHCVVCQAAGTMALPAAGPEVLLSQAEPRASTPAAPAALPFRPTASARARAPPLV